MFTFCSYFLFFHQRSPLRSINTNLLPLHYTFLKQLFFKIDIMSYYYSVSSGVHKNGQEREDYGDAEQLYLLQALPSEIWGEMAVYPPLLAELLRIFGCE